MCRQATSGCVLPFSMCSQATSGCVLSVSVGSQATSGCVLPVSICSQTTSGCVLSRHVRIMLCVQRSAGSLNPNAVLTARLVGPFSANTQPREIPVANYWTATLLIQQSVQLSTAAHEFSWQRSVGFDWRQWQPFFLSVQIVSKAYPFSYPVGISGSFSVVKAAGAWCLPLTTIYYRNKSARWYLVNSELGRMQQDD